MLVRTCQKSYRFARVHTATDGYVLTRGHYNYGAYTSLSIFTSWSLDKCWFLPRLTTMTKPKYMCTLTRSDTSLLNLRGVHSIRHQHKHGSLRQYVQLIEEFLDILARADLVVEIVELVEREQWAVDFIVLYVSNQRKTHTQFTWKNMLLHSCRHRD